MKKVIVLTTVLTLLFGLSSCSKSETKIENYKNETTYNEFIKWEDKFNDLKRNKDYIVIGKNDATRTYDLLEDNVVIETYKAESHENIEVKNDYDNKMITQKNNSNSKSETKTNAGVENSKSNAIDEYFAQYYNDLFYKFNKKTKSVIQMFNYDIYLGSLVQITGLVSQDNFDKFYIDNDIYTAVKEEENTISTIQCSFKNDSFTFKYVIDKNETQEINNDKIKKEKSYNSLEINFKFKEVELTPYTDLSEYKFN